MIKVSVWKDGRPNEGQLVEEKILTPMDALHNELVQKFLFWSSTGARGGPETRIDSIEDSRHLVIQHERLINGSCVDFFVVFEEVSPFVIGEYSELGALHVVAKWYAEATGLCNDAAKRSIAGDKLLEW